MSEELIRKALREELAPLRQEIEQTRKLLTGNGNPEKGLIVRVDRIEQSEKSKTYWFRTITVLVITALLSSIRALLR